jgi:hypothetical protein
MLRTAVTDLVADILREIRVINALDPAEAPDQALVLRKMNRVIDRWNADRQAVYAEQITRFVIVPGTQPHTIGPGYTGPPGPSILATWVTTGRPVSIESASWIDGSGFSTPINLRNSEWWAAQVQKTLTSAYPTDLYYEPAYTGANGNVYLWPKPTTAYSVDLQLRLVLAQLAIGDVLVQPPGYEDALLKTTAEECVGIFGVDMPPNLPTLAREARALIFANNSETLPLVSDAPGAGAGGAFFDYRTGRYSR